MANVVHLPHIHSNLYLCNLAFVKEKKAIGASQYVDCRLFADDSTMLYESFNKHVDFLANQIHENLCKGKCIVYCHKGVNRSVSAIIAYAMSVKKYDNVASVIQYIRETKAAEISSYWPTLTNVVFAAYLDVRESATLGTDKGVVQPTKRASRRIEANKGTVGLVVTEEAGSNRSKKRKHRE